MFTAKFSPTVHHLTRCREFVDGAVPGEMKALHRRLSQVQHPPAPPDWTQVSPSAHHHKTMQYKKYPIPIAIRLNLGLLHKKSKMYDNAEVPKRTL